jgi:Holliday junction resolvase
MQDKPTPDWFKSSYTANCEVDCCVEVAVNRPQEVLIRDSKATWRPHLTVSPSAFDGLVRFARNSQI